MKILFPIQLDTGMNPYNGLANLSISRVIARRLALLLEKWALRVVRGVANMAHRAGAEVGAEIL